MATLLAFGLCAYAPTAAYSQPTQGTQENPSNTIIPSIDLESADVRDALKILFKNVGVSYSVAADVQGNITLHITDKPFETTLEAILKQVDATYRVDAGVYTIIKKEDTTGVVATPDQTDTTTQITQKKRLVRIKILHADPALILTLLTGRLNIGGGPEISALSSSGGGGGIGGGGGFGGGGFGGGGGGLGGGIGGGGLGGGIGGGGGGLGGGIGGGGLGGGGFGGGGGIGGGGFGGGGGIGGGGGFGR
jgi:hypothetical protein